MLRQPAEDPQMKLKLKTKSKHAYGCRGPQIERSYCQEATQKPDEFQGQRRARHCHCFHANKQMSQQIAGARGHELVVGTVWNGLLL